MNSISLWCWYNRGTHRDKWHALECGRRRRRGKKRGGGEKESEGWEIRERGREGRGGGGRRNGDNAGTV